MKKISLIVDQIKNEMKDKVTQKELAKIISQEYGLEYDQSMISKRLRSDKKLSVLEFILITEALSKPAKKILSKEFVENYIQELKGGK